jgi:ATP-dependent helicase/nuclease subunit B
VESFSKCAFAYYCKYGLRAQPRGVAELDPMQKGTILHLVLQKLLEKYPGKMLLKLTREQRLAEIHAIMDEYLEERMGGRQEKPKRFEYLYNRLADIMDEVAARLAKEFETGSFEPVAFELKIDSDGAVKPYEIMLENGGTLKINGSIDRVDKMEKDSKSYIRVVDYKSSGKAFSLAEVLEGINMQMLIYLFALWQNGAPLYGDIVPAGVLYMAANAPTANLDRNAADFEIEREKLKKSKMNGMLLKNLDVILGMEEDGEGIFIPAKIKNGELEGTLITLEQMAKLKIKADEILAKMAKALQSGDIPALPAIDAGYKSACDYCDYLSVCGRESGMPARIIPKLKHEEALALIDNEGGDGNAVDG